MTLPTLHMNGTSKEELVGNLCAAITALNDAYEAMKQCAPHGRDYYPQGSNALKKATDEHLARLRLVDQVKLEMEALVNAIDAIGD